LCHATPDYYQKLLKMTKMDTKKDTKTGCKIGYPMPVCIKKGRGMNPHPFSNDSRWTSRPYGAAEAPSHAPI
jgi:hypothetical protein